MLRSYFHRIIQVSNQKSFIFKDNWKCQKYFIKIKISVGLFINYTYLYILFLPPVAKTSIIVMARCRSCGTECWSSSCEVHHRLSLCSWLAAVHQLLGPTSCQVRGKMYRHDTRIPRSTNAIYNYLYKTLCLINVLCNCDRECLWGSEEAGWVSACSTVQSVVCEQFTIGANLILVLSSLCCYLGTDSLVQSGNWKHSNLIMNCILCSIIFNIKIVGV